MGMSFAQTQNLAISGRLADSEDGSPVIGAVVMMISIKDSTDVYGATTGTDGRFVVKDLPRSFYRLKTRSLGYKEFTRVFRVTTSADIGNITLAPDAKLLDEIEVEAEVIPVENRGDTTLYNADAFKVNPDASAADLVAKMPGIRITDQGVEAQGEAVQQVLLDGKRFFGQDPLLALNTIPAEVVNKVEVFDQQSERAQITGVDDGNTTKTMNVVTKEGKREGMFGKFQAGYGTDERHKVEGSFNQRSGDKQFTILGMTNNVNQRSFTDSDILGAGGSRRGRFFGNSGSNTQQTGITLTESVGANFSDDWGKKGKIETSYFFDKSNFENVEETSRETFFDQGTQIYEEVNRTERDNVNHRLNMRLEYNFSDRTSLVFRPRVSIQDNERQTLTSGETSVAELPIGETINNFTSESNGYSIGGEVLLRHKLNDIGRAILVEFEPTMNDFDYENVYDDQLVDSTLLYFDGSSNFTYNTEISYLEPIGLKGQLQVEYDYVTGTRRADRETYSVIGADEDRILQESLSNRFASDLIQHRPGVSFSHRGVQNFFRAQLEFENTTYSADQSFPGESTGTKNFNVVLPTVMSRLQLGSETSMFFRYAANTQQPSAGQLQELVDNSNPLFFSTGNSDLDQSYTHSFFARISSSNADKNSSWSNFVLMRNTSDYVTNGTFLFARDTTLSNGVVLPRGTQLSRPVNLDGFWTATNKTSYSFMVPKLKMNMNYDLAFAYNRRPGLANNVENVSNTFSIIPGASINSNISENVDYTIGYTANFNRVTNSIQERQESQYLTHVVSGKLNLIFLQGTVFRTDFSYQIYDGISGDFDTQYFLWNMSIARKFLKNDLAEIALTVFDLLDQNTGLTQNVTSNFVEESRSLVLKQYFMLSVTYNLRKFKSN